MSIVGGLLQRLPLRRAPERRAGRPTPESQEVPSGQPAVSAAELQGYVSESRRLQQELQENIAELQRSRERIVTVEETVREEIAERLHSRVQTRLLIASNDLARCGDLLLENDHTQALALLTTVREDIDLIRERQVREVSHLLHPSEIRIGLEAAVRSLVSRYEHAFTVVLTLDPDLAALDVPFQHHIPEPVRLAAYRVLEEGLSNVHRHASASSAAVRIGLSVEGELELVMIDNGRGFEVACQGPGLGLMSIDDRVGVAGGTWGISPFSNGTKLWVLLPLNRAAEAAPAADEQEGA